MGCARPPDADRRRRTGLGRGYRPGRCTTAGSPPARVAHGRRDPHAGSAPEPPMDDTERTSQDQAVTDPAERLGASGGGLPRGQTERRRASATGPLLWYERDDVEFSRATAFFDATYALATTLLVTTLDPGPDGWSSWSDAAGLGGPAARRLRHLLRRGGRLLVAQPHLRVLVAGPLAPHHRWRHRRPVVHRAAAVHDRGPGARATRSRPWSTPSTSPSSRSPPRPST